MLNSPKVGSSLICNQLVKVIILNQLYVDKGYHKMSGDIVYTKLSLDLSLQSKEEINSQIDGVMEMVNKYLSEPYSVFVYRFFLNNWPDLCLIARDMSKDGAMIGCIISKIEGHRDVRLRGYIGMLAVDEKYRGRGIAKELIGRNIDSMIDEYHADEIILETEVVNKPALRLYENFGFLRTKRLFRYYLNKHDAYRLILPISERALQRSKFLPPLPEDSLVVAKY